MELGDKTLSQLMQKMALSIPYEERENFCQELSQITKWVEKLNELDTKEIIPQKTMSVNTNVFATGEPSPPMPLQKALANAPEHDHAYFHVPSISKKS